MKSEAPRSLCPVNAAVEILGDRWSLLVLRDMVFLGKTQYNEFLESEEGISTNILADRLVQLESNGMIRKVEKPKPGIRAQYYPTEKTLDLIPMLLEMIVWSERHQPVSEKTHALVKRIRKDREAVVREVRERNWRKP